MDAKPNGLYPSTSGDVCKAAVSKLINLHFRVYQVVRKNSGEMPWSGFTDFHKYDRRSIKDTELVCLRAYSWMTNTLCSTSWFLQRLQSYKSKNLLSANSALFTSRYDKSGDDRCYPSLCNPWKLLFHPNIIAFLFFDKIISSASSRYPLLRYATIQTLLILTRQLIEHQFGNKEVTAPAHCVH